jgi:hypothetical protein
MAAISRMAAHKIRDSERSNLILCMKAQKPRSGWNVRYTK